MSKRPARSRAAAAPPLSIPERVLASDTDWEHAGITGTTVTAMIVRGLIQRDPAGRLWLTKEGRAVLAALLAKGRQWRALARPVMLELPSPGDHER